MKHVLIINPAAGKCDRTVQIKELAEEVFAAKGLEYELKVSQAPGDCARLAKEAAETGEEVRLYACGGDGTLNEVINGAAGFDNAAVTHFPAGSGNDFIKIFSDRAAFRSLENLLECEEAAFDLIECTADGKRCFAANIVSMGLDARIGTEMGRYRRLPLVTGSGAYYLSTAVNLCKGIARTCKIRVNGEVISGEQTLVCVCNGRYYGGGFNPVPQAEPDDGLLDVLVIKKVNLIQVAQVIGKFKKGQYEQCPDLIRHLRTDQIEIVYPKENVVNVDGEAVWGKKVRFRVSEHKVRFFYPKGLTYCAKNREKTAVKV